jgi:hypothetical protein
MVKPGVARRAPSSVGLVDQRTLRRFLDRVVAGWQARLKPSESERAAMAPGARVEVFSSFTASWVRGFEIASIFNDGYRVRRLSDRSVLPKTFVIGELRAPYV